MAAIDETHDPALTSWVESAQGSAFPIQNLPFGVFRRAGSGEAARVGVAIGDRILDVEAVTPLLDAGAQAAAAACASSSLNALMALGRPAYGALRKALSRLLSDPAARAAVLPHLTGQSEAELLLPVEVGDYSDFYASVYHATNVGRLFRPDNPLMPNYKWVPIGYHGRASSLVASGAPVRRPTGQILPPGETRPVFGPSRALDYELELGLYIGAPSRGAIPMAEAGSHLFGVSLLNDWSARDIQAWEYQPLGPFLSKSFATTLSPWVVTMEALAPFRTAAFARAEGDPEPLPHLSSSEDQAEGGLDIEVEALIASEQMRLQGQDPMRLSAANAGDLYWTAAQMIAHHASNGLDLETGDLLGTGTISGPDQRHAGCLLEITRRGAEPVSLPTGETRRFLEDGDELILRGQCRREGFVTIGLGECRGLVLPSG